MANSCVSIPCQTKPHSGYAQLTQLALVGRFRARTICSENGQISPIHLRNQWFSKRQMRRRRTLLNLLELRKVLERADLENFLKVFCNRSVEKKCADCTSAATVLR